MRASQLFLVTFFIFSFSLSAIPTKPVAGGTEYSLLAGMPRYSSDREYAKGVDYAYDYYLHIVGDCQPVSYHNVPGGKGIPDERLEPGDINQPEMGYTYQCDTRMLNTYYELLALYKSYPNTSYNQGLIDGLMAAYMDKVRNKVSRR